MSRIVFFRNILLFAIFALVLGCTTENPVRETDGEKWIVPPPKFQTENYLNARAKIIERVVPEERPSAVRILEWMMEFMAKDICKPEEISIQVSDLPAKPDQGWPPRTYVDLSLGKIEL